MPLFHFHLRDCQSRILDPDGVDLQDLSEAEAYATQVARELMRNADSGRRFWQIDVCDADGTFVRTVPFATVDPTLDHLRPSLRRMADSLYAGRARIADTMVRLFGFAMASPTGWTTRPAEFSIGSKKVVQSTAPRAR